MGVSLFSSHLSSYGSVVYFEVLGLIVTLMLVFTDVFCAAGSTGLTAFVFR